MNDAPLSLKQAAEQVGVSPATLRRWVRAGAVPQADGDGWTAGAVAHARVVARMRERGYSLNEIRAAVRDGRLAFGSVEDLLPTSRRRHTRAQAAAEVGMEEELVERIMGLLGTPMAMADRLSDEDIEALRKISGILEEGLPLVALLQLVRVYAQSIRKIAEAEVRLFHLFVHEPMIRDGVPATACVSRPAAVRLLPETRSPTAPVNGRSPAVASGITARRDRGHQRKAWWSPSAADHDVPSCSASSRRGRRRSETSKRDAWTPRTRPSSVASWPMPSTRLPPSGWRYDE